MFHLFTQICGQSLHLLFKRNPVILFLLNAHVASGGEDEGVLLDLFQLGGLAEPGHVFIRPIFGLAPPGVVGAGDGGKVLFGQLAVRPVGQFAQLAGVDEERFAVPRPEAPLRVGGFGAGQEPKADRDLRGVEELPRHGDHAVHQISFDHAFADGEFIVGAGGHRAVRHDEPRQSGGGEVVDEVLDPGIVRVPAVHVDRGAVALLAGAGLWRRAESPADVVFHLAEAPVFHIEGRVGEQEVAAQVLVLVVQEGVAPLDIAVNAADRQVHLAQLPGGVVGFLPVNGDIRMGVPAVAVA